MLASRALIRSAFMTGAWKAFRGDNAIGADDLNIGPHSIDVSLGDRFMRQEQYHTGMGDGNKIRRKEKVLDPYKPLEEQEAEYREFQMDRVFLAPGDFLLGFTRERFDSTKPLSVEVGSNAQCGAIVSNFAFTQIYDGRSTMGRLGIMSHVTAGYGDYGFSGNFTLELANVGDATIILHAGMRIGQVSFHGILGGLMGVPTLYSGAYQKQLNHPVAPVLGVDRFKSPGE